MSSLFESVEIVWKGKSYTIPPNKVLRAIAKIEDVITLQHLSNQDAVPMAKVALAFAALLRFAGARVSDDEVYEELFDHHGASALAVINMLLSLILPKKVREKMESMSAEDEQRGSSEGNVDAPTGAAS